MADGKRELAYGTAPPVDRLIRFYEARGYRESVVLSKHLAPG